MTETVKMGFEGRVFLGAAGSTANTLLTNVRDISEEFTPSKGNTTVRGDGSAPPIPTERVTARGYALEITMLNDSGDANLATLKAAVKAGTAVAIKTEDYDGGDVNFDGDMTFGMSDPWPLDGEQVITFRGTPNRGNGREPAFS